MRKIITIYLLALIPFISRAQEDDSLFISAYDSIENTFHYQHGEVALPNGVAKVIVPDGYKFLDGTQAERVLVELWGNPKGEDLSLGFLVPENQGIMDESGYVFNIQYDEMGYVKDDDAEEINYDELLTEMQKGAEEENAERVKNGFDAVKIIGWASPPFYDKEKKILHWAKEVRFSQAEVNTLNYNIRVLGRKGVLVINAISVMPSLAAVKKDIPSVLTAVQFNEGFQYKDYDSNVDEVAAWTIGGLVAGKILAKVGFFALLLKFWKLIAIAVVAFFGTIWKRIRGKKDEPVAPVNEPAEEATPPAEPENNSTSSEIPPSQE